MIETRGPGARSGFEKQEASLFYEGQRDTASRNVAFALFYGHGNANRGGGYSCCSFCTPSRRARLTGGARVGRRDSRVPGACGCAAGRAAPLALGLQLRYLQGVWLTLSFALEKATPRKNNLNNVEHSPVGLEKSARARGAHNIITL